MMTDEYSALDVGEALVAKNVYDFEAANAITKGQAVKLVDVANDLPKVDVAGAGDKAIGIAAKSVAAGEQCSVYGPGSIVKVTFGGAVTVGNAVKAGASGKVVSMADQAVDEGGSATYMVYYSMRCGVAWQTIAADADTGLIEVVN